MGVWIGGRLRSIASSGVGGTRVAVAVLSIGDGGAGVGSGLGDGLLESGNGMNGVVACFLRGLC